MSACRSCGAPVIWTKTAGGKSMPVDAEPPADGNGNVRVDGIGERSAPVATVLGPLEVAMLAPEVREELRLSHFVTCPDAKDWKR